MGVVGFGKGCEYDTAEVGVGDLTPKVSGQTLLSTKIFNVFNEVPILTEHRAPKGLVGVNSGEVIAGVVHFHQ